MERLRTDAPLEGVAWRHTRKDGSFLDVELAETQLTSRASRRGWS